MFSFEKSLLIIKYSYLLWLFEYVDNAKFAEELILQQPSIRTDKEGFVMYASDALTYAHEIQNSKLIRRIRNKETTFKKYVENLMISYKSQRKEAFYDILLNPNLLKSLNEHKLITKQDAMHVLHLTNYFQCMSVLNQNVNLIEFMADQGLFLMLVNQYKSKLNLLFQHNRLMQRLLEQNKISKYDVTHLMLSITNFNTLLSFVQNRALIQYVLKNSMIDLQFFETFEAILKKANSQSKTSAKTIFELIAKEYERSTSNNILTLNEIASKLCSILYLTTSEKLEITKICENNTDAYNNLLLVAENNIESTFESFEELMKYLIKPKHESSLVI